MSQGDAVYAIHWKVVSRHPSNLLDCETNPSSIAQTAGICNEDSDGEIDSAVAELIEDLSSTISRDIVATSHHDESEHSRSNHQCEALRTSPDIEDLSIRKLPESTDQTRDDARSCGEGVCLERARHVGCQCA
jgi:hypothetical protein